jgi:hypothetical protein
MGKTVTMKTSDEIKDYLLCRDCEQRFNDNGEKWCFARGQSSWPGDLLPATIQRVHVPTLAAFWGQPRGTAEWRVPPWAANP